MIGGMLFRFDVTNIFLRVYTVHGERVIQERPSWNVILP